MDIYELIFCTVGGIILLSAAIYTVVVPVVLIRHVIKSERIGVVPDTRLVRNIQRIGLGILGAAFAVVLVVSVITVFSR